MKKVLLNPKAIAIFAGNQKKKIPDSHTQTATNSLTKKS